MKNILFSTAIAAMLFSCAGQPTEKKDSECSTANQEKSACCNKTKNETKESAETISQGTIEVTVDQLLESPEKYLDKKIDLKGFVMHTCKKSGKKMFLKGTSDSLFIKVEAGENISEFKSELEGVDVVATGIISSITSEQTHESDSCTSENKAKGYILSCESFKQI